MVDGERKPGLRMRRPHALLVTTRIHTEQVRDTRRCELPVETAVLGAEAGVAAADVERKERLPVREASGEADDRAPLPVRNRAEVAVDVVHDVTRDRRLPVPSVAPVEVTRDRSLRRERPGVRRLPRSGRTACVSSSRPAAATARSNGGGRSTSPVSCGRSGSLSGCGRSLLGSAASAAGSFLRPWPTPRRSSRREP